MNNPNDERKETPLDTAHRLAKLTTAERGHALTQLGDRDPVFCADVRRILVQIGQPTTPLRGLRASALIFDEYQSCDNSRPAGTGIPGTCSTKYSWNWRTGTLTRSFSYLSADSVDAGTGDEVVLCLWGWTKRRPEARQLRPLNMGEIMQELQKAPPVRPGKMVAPDPWPDPPARVEQRAEYERVAKAGAISREQALRPFQMGDLPSGEAVKQASLGLKHAGGVLSQGAGGSINSDAVRRIHFNVVRVLCSEDRDTAVALLKWVDRIVARKDQLPASFLDNIDPTPLAKKAREWLNMSAHGVLPVRLEETARDELLIIQHMLTGAGYPGAEPHFGLDEHGGLTLIPVPAEKQLRDLLTHYTSLKDLAAFGDRLVAELETAAMSQTAALLLTEWKKRRAL